MRAHEEVMTKAMTAEGRQVVKYLVQFSPEMGDIDAKNYGLDVFTEDENGRKLEIFPLTLLVLLGLGIDEIGQL